MRIIRIYVVNVSQVKQSETCLPIEKIPYNFHLTVGAHIVRPSTVQPRKRPRANTVRPYKMCTREVFL